MNKGNYGYPQAPNRALRVAPQEWRNYKLITATTSVEVVPQNVYQVLCLVFGGGATAPNPIVSGGGGGFAAGILDVLPGQTLPIITVGAIGGTSSLGTLISATGASGITPGTGAVSATLRGGFTASGGSGFSTGAPNGAASGSYLGNGGNAGTADRGGCAWGGVTPGISTTGGTTTISVPYNDDDGWLAIANRRALPGKGATSATEFPGFGCGAFSQDNNTMVFPSPVGGGGGYGATVGGRGGYGGGGGGGIAVGTGGTGIVILYWTEGY